MTKEHIKALALITIQNCVVTICFTFLAFAFDKWWIALFSALFYKSFTYTTEVKNEKD